jgi:hypothetical protein
MSAPTNESIAVVTELAKINVKLDTLLEKSGDHEKRLRSLELNPTATAKNWPIVMTNALMTIANALLVGSQTVGR